MKNIKIYGVIRSNKIKCVKPYLNIKIDNNNTIIQHVENR